MAEEQKREWELMADAISEFLRNPTDPKYKETREGWIKEIERKQGTKRKRRRAGSL